MDINQSTIDSLGAKLDAASLTSEERQTLEAAFALAGHVIAERAEADEVSGFAMPRAGVFQPIGWSPRPVELISIDVNADSNEGINYDVNFDDSSGK